MNIFFMNIPFLLEAKSNFRRTSLFEKVEQYISITNQWLATYSEAALEQAHRVIQELQSVELEKYLSIGEEWLLDTPQRALTHAYDTAVILKKIEDEYFDGNPVISIENYSNGVSSYFHLVLRKSLFVIQVRLLEFKASYPIISGQSLNELENNSKSNSILEKLTFIDKVLIRYQVQPTYASSPVNDSPVSPKPVVEISEPEIHHDPVNQWEFLESLLLDFDNEEKSQVSQKKTGNSSQVSQKTITVKTPPSTSQLHPQLIGHLATHAGFASIIFFAGGLTIGGLSSWAFLSAQNQMNDRNKCLRSTEVNPGSTHIELMDFNLSVKPSPPEVLRPEATATAVYMNAYELF